MAQSTCVLFGFFALASGRRAAVPKPNQPPNSSAATYYCFYNTSVQCSDGSAIPAEIRIYSPRNDTVLPDNTIAFVVAKAHFPPNALALLDAIRLVPLPGDPNSDSYEDSAPDLPYPFAYGIGVIVAKATTLADGKSRGFLVDVHERVRDVDKPSRLQCVLSGDSPRWANVPPPHPSTLRHFLGACTAVLSDSTLAISVELVNYNLAPPPPPASATPSPHKRKKFNAFAPTITSISVVPISLTGPDAGSSSPLPAPASVASRAPPDLSYPAPGPSLSLPASGVSTSLSGVAERSSISSASHSRSSSPFTPPPDHNPPAAISQHQLQRSSRRGRSADKGKAT